MLEDRDLDARALGSGRIDGYVNVKRRYFVSVEARSGVLDASITMGPAPWMPVPEVPEGRAKVKRVYIEIHSRSEEASPAARRRWGFG